MVQATSLAGQRGDVDDRTVFAQERPQGLDGEEDTVQVDGHARSPIRFDDLRQRQVLVETSAGHNVIHLSEGLPTCLGNALGVLHLSDIVANGQTIGLSAQRGGEALETCLVDVG